MINTEPVYQITRSEYDALISSLNNIQEILSNAKIVNEKGNTETEKLADSTMRALFGIKYQYVLCYNFDFKQWNTHHILEKKMRVDALKLAEKAYCKLKHILESDPKFKNREVVAIATMPVMEDLDNETTTIQQPTPALSTKYQSNTILPNGGAGTIICRDKITGKILPIPNIWIAVSYHVNSNCGTKTDSSGRQRHGGLKYTPRRFAQDCIDTPQKLNALKKLYTR